MADTVLVGVSVAVGLGGAAAYSIVCAAKGRAPELPKIVASFLAGAGLIAVAKLLVFALLGRLPFLDAGRAGEAVPEQRVYLGVAGIVLAWFALQRLVSSLRSAWAPMIEPTTDRRSDSS